MTRESLNSSAPWGVRCPLCGTRAVTTEAPCECGFRFPRGYGNEEAVARDIEARDIRVGDDLFGAGLVTNVFRISENVRVCANGTLTFEPDEIVTVRRA